MLANYVNGRSGTAAGQAVCVNSKCVRATYTALESFGSGKTENMSYASSSFDRRGGGGAHNCTLYVVLSIPSQEGE